MHKVLNNSLLAALLPALFPALLAMSPSLSTAQQAQNGAPAKVQF